MADSLTVAGAISYVQAGQSIVKSGGFGGIGRVSAVKLDSQLKPAPFTKTQVVLSGPESQSALNVAIAAGTGILNSLNQLKSTAALATRESLVSPLVSLTIGGTRVSRINIHSSVYLTLSRIDRLVANTEVNNANFISSTGSSIQIRTSRFGGRVGIIPQPLDRAGLGLSGLDLLTKEGAEAAVSSIQSAINLAGLRLDRLKSLRLAVGSSNFTGQALQNIIVGAGGGNLPSGSLVSLIG